MLKNLDTQILSFNGDQLQVDGKPGLMKDVIFNALIVPDKDMDGEGKFKRGKLAERVYSGGEQDFKPEELALMKEVIGKFYPQVVVVRVWEFLDK